MLAAADLRPSDDERQAGEQFGRLLDSLPGSSRPDDVWGRVKSWASVAGSTMGTRCRVLEEAGGRLLGESFPATVGLLAPLLDLIESPLYDSVLGGDLRGSATSVGRWSGDADGLVVLGAPKADVVAVVSDHQVELVKPNGAMPALGSDLTREFGRIDPNSCEQLAAPRTVPTETLERWLAAARVAVAADMVGSARAVFDLAVSYLKGRHQFGQPVAAFQAVQHKLVDMALLVETASAALHYAACCVDAGSENALVAAGVAKARAATAATGCAGSSVRLTGAVGLTWDNDLHLHLRRAYASDQLLGSTAHLRRELGRAAARRL